MNAKEFQEKLRDIEQATREQVTQLVWQAQKEEGLDSNTDKPLSINNDPNWQRTADGFAELSGWIYDRVNGINRLHRKSVTKKIRKALGYTYP